MLKNPHFYNRTIRKIVVAFGSIFNDIVIVRQNRAGTIDFEQQKVPLAYSPKEKYIQRITNDPTFTKSILTTLPRMGFEMVGLNYDSTRKQASTLMNCTKNAEGGYNRQYAPVPYNFDFTLSIFTRNIEDATQIVEQILPFFTPDFTVTIKLNDDMEQKYTIPIVLNSVNPDIQYEGDFSDTRIIIWTLDFTVKGYIFPQVKSSNNFISSANTNVLSDTRNVSNQKVYVDMTSGNGVYTTGETIRVENKNVYGKVTYFANNSTGSLIVEDMNSFISNNDIVIGDYSHATYRVNAIDQNPVIAFNVLTRPDPIDAGPNDDYGFTETITEWPDTLI